METALSVVTTIATVVVAIVTCIYAYYTHRVVLANEAVVAEQTRPYIVVGLPSRNRKIDLSIKNIGRRPAYDISIVCTPDLREIALTEQGDSMFRPLMAQRILSPNDEVLGLVGLTPQIVRADVAKVFEFRVS